MWPRVPLSSWLVLASISSFDFPRCSVPVTISVWAVSRAKSELFSRIWMTTPYLSLSNSLSWLLYFYWSEMKHSLKLCVVSCDSWNTGSQKQSCHVFGVWRACWLLQKYLSSFFPSSCVGLCWCHLLLEISPRSLGDSRTYCPGGFYSKKKNWHIWRKERFYPESFLSA